MNRHVALMMMALAMAENGHLPPEPRRERHLGPHSPPNPFGQPKREPPPNECRCPSRCALHRAERVSAAMERRVRRALRVEVLDG